MTELAALRDALVDLYGYKIEMGMAIGEWRKMMERTFRDLGTGPDKNVTYGLDDPNDPEAVYQYRTTRRRLLSASGPNGLNQRLLHHSVIIYAYSLWEDRYRQRIARECGISKNDIESDVFYELNTYRQAAVHSFQKIKREPKILAFFAKGDRMEFTAQQMQHLFRQLIHELNRIGAVYYDSDPDFSLDQRLN